MKKYLIWLPVVVVVMGAAMYQPVKEAMTEKPFDKNISFAVYKGNTYASEIYNSTSAKLHITIEKVSGRKRTIVWSKTFDAKLLKQYPSLEHALFQTVTVPKVIGNDRLEITYTLTYNSNGSELQMQNGTIVSGKMKSNKLEISI